MSKGIKSSVLNISQTIKKVKSSIRNSEISEKYDLMLSTH